MRRTLSAVGLSLTLALGAAPARAEIVYADQLPAGRQDAAAAALAALVALGVIAALVDDDDDDDRDRVDVRRRGHDERGHDDWGHDDWDLDVRRDGRVLTAECVRHVRGGQRVVAGECLRRHGHRARLPEACRSWVRVGGRDRPVYDMRCLRGSGYHVR